MILMEIHKILFPPKLPPLEVFTKKLNCNVFDTTENPNSTNPGSVPELKIIVD